MNIPNLPNILAQPSLLQMHSECLHQPTNWQDHLTESPVYNKVLTILCKLLNTVLKVKRRIVKQVQNVCKCISYSPHDCVADWELQLATTAQHHERGSYRILLAWEKIKIRSTISIKYVLLLHNHKVKKNHKRQKILCNLTQEVEEGNYKCQLLPVTSFRNKDRTGYAHFLS